MYAIIETFGKLRICEDKKTGNTIKSDSFKDAVEYAEENCQDGLILDLDTFQTYRSSDHTFFLQ